MNISLCITTYNRYELLLESFSKVIDNPRITEIIIVDDCSEEKYWKKIKDLPKFNPKIKVFRQVANRGMSRNKADAIAYAENQWCIIFDSDNVIDDRYIDAIPEKLLPYVIYCPAFAEPTFDYRKWESMSLGRHNAPFHIKYDDNFNMLMNTCNYLVNKTEYLKLYEENASMKGTDTIWFNYLWIKAGSYFSVLPGCHYYHRVHEGSGFMQDVNYNMTQAEYVRKLISQL